MLLTDPKQIIARCKELQTMHGLRNRLINQWYTMLEQVPNPVGAIPDKMEVFTGNDPRTFFNYGRFILSSPIIVHKLDSLRLTQEESQFIDSLSLLVQSGWKDNYRRISRQGRGEWMERFVGMLLAQGHYAIACGTYKDRLTATVWNPYQVFPNFDGHSEGPSEVARVFKVHVSTAYQICKQNGWAMPDRAFGYVDIYNYYAYDNKGKVYQAVVVQDKMVFHRRLVRYSRIPVFVGAVGGIPGADEVNTGNSNRFVYGESLINTNYNIYRTLDRQMSFHMQVSHDAALPPIVEKSSDGSPIVNSDELYDRGLIFRLGP